MHHMNQCISMSVHRNGAEKEGGGNLVGNEALKTQRGLREEVTLDSHK